MTTCPLSIPNCVCLDPDGPHDMHAPPARPCECGGQTGLHAFGCPKMDTRVVFFSLEERLATLRQRREESER
jgi:hypothetical protein